MLMTYPENLIVTYIARTRETIVIRTRWDDIELVEVTKLIKKNRLREIHKCIINITSRIFSAIYLSRYK